MGWPAPVFVLLTHHGKDLAALKGAPGDQCAMLSQLR